MPGEDFSTLQPDDPVNRSKPPAEPDDGILSVLPVDADGGDLPFALPAPPESQVALPARRPPHPGFWWSLAWCFAAVSAMQQVATVVVAPVLIIEMVKLSQQYTPKDQQARQNPMAESFEMMKKLLESDIVSTMMLIAQGLGHATLLLFSWAAIRTVVGRDWQRRLALRWPDAAHLALLLLAFPALMLLNEGIGKLIEYLVPSLKDLGMPYDLEELMKQIAQWPWLPALLVIAIAPALAEELFCRGFLGQGLVGRYGWAVGILITSLLFGLIHMIPRQAVFAFLMGVVLHFLYLTSRSLWLPMLLHFLNNGLAVLAMTQTADRQPRFPIFSQLLELPNRHPGLLYSTAALLVAAVGLALYQCRVRLMSEGGNGPPSWQPDYPGVDYPPPDSGTVAARPWPGALAIGLLVLAAGAFGAACYAVLVHPEWVS